MKGACSYFSFDFGWYSIHFEKKKGSSDQYHVESTFWFEATSGFCCK